MVGGSGLAGIFVSRTRFDRDKKVRNVLAGDESPTGERREKKKDIGGTQDATD